MRLMRERRVSALLARRQYGKTTLSALIALSRMMAKPGHSVVFGSVKVDLGREIIRQEAEAIWRAVHTAEVPDGLVQSVDAQTGRSVDGLEPDDISDLYEHSRLEFRFYHSRSVYSRTKVVALTPDAVGETGDLILDEVGRVRRFDEVWEAVKPIISSQPNYRCILTTTPPPDDGHFSYELLSPPMGAEFPVDPAGNVYRSDLGIAVLRVTAWDAHADGVAMFDDETGKRITPDESRARDHDKDAWDRNWACKFVMGGTSACSLLVLDTAQRRGVDQCALFLIHADSDMHAACHWIRTKTGKGTVGIGLDVATTTKATSNPTAIAVCERYGAETIVRAVLVWKTADPKLSEERIRECVQAVHQRPSGGPAKRLCIDATSERYFAESLRRSLAGLLPVELVVASETYEGPGMSEPLTLKQYLGSELVGELEDNHLWLPPERYLREDFRLVKKERGSFTCDPDGAGRHGDTFDAAKLGLRALRGSAASEFAYSNVERGVSRLGRMWS